jgi:hypothetical protein
MPRRKPRNLDAFRFELGTFERDLLRDRNMIDGVRAAALPLSAGLLGLGIAMGGFLAMNKVDDLKEWVSDAWEDGFGLVNDPAQTQEQVSNSIAPDNSRTPDHLKGMSVNSIYDLHYQQRDELCQYFSRMWCEFEGREFTGENHAHFLKFYWSTSWLGTSFPSNPTYRFERNEVIKIDGADVNTISEYTYQMIIRETDSRNTQARITSGLFGAASTGIGAAFSEATHWALRSSGFMQGNDGWDGQNWEEAPGANRDPLLMYAWARTDFKTGKWWSTADSQGDVGFWLDVNAGLQGGSKAIETNMTNPQMFDAWSYEQIIFYAHQEMTNAEWGPFIQFLSRTGGLPLVASTPDPLPPVREPTPEEEQQSIQDQIDAANDSGRDDYMPGEEPPQDSTDDQYGPPR